MDVCVCVSEHCEGGVGEKNFQFHMCNVSIYTHV